MTYNKDMKSRQVRLILLIFWLILAGLIVWFRVLPLGRATYSLTYPAKWNLLDGKGFIGRLSPQDRVEIKSGEAAKIIGDPVYFSVFTPRTFSEAKITITYKDNLTSSTPIIEAGVLVDNIVWRYKLAPLENKLLDSKFKDWYKLRDGNILLLQKNKNFATVNEFLDILKNKSNNLCRTIDPKSCLVLYNTDSLAAYLPVPLLPKEIVGFNPIDIPLQGTHQFYFIGPAKKSLNFEFNFVDLNLNKQSDPVIISLYQGANKIYSTTILDNFGGEGSGQTRSFSVPLVYQVSASSSVLYKLEIKGDDDIVIKKIVKAPSALNFISRIRPVTVPNLPISFWTDSSFVDLTTNNPGSRQILNFDGHNFSLTEAYKQFEFLSSKNGLKELSLNRDDVILENDGVFSLTPETFFNPEFKKLDRHFVLNNETEYVLSEYQSPELIDNDFKKATVTLYTKEAYREKGKYSFMLSIPGLSLAGSGNVLIKEIKVEFSGRTLWDKIKEKINSYVN